MTHKTYEDANHISVQDAVSCTICNPREFNLGEYNQVLERGDDARFAHRHTCLSCFKVIAVGQFDCESESDHDFELCGACGSVSEALYEEDGEQEDFAHEQAVANANFLSRI